MASNECIFLKGDTLGQNESVRMRLRYTQMGGQGQLILANPLSLQVDTSGGKGCRTMCPPGGAGGGSVTWHWCSDEVVFASVRLGGL